jgi:predicted membrane protein
MYPNEVELQWSVLIVVYPFVTGLVAGAFILASLERIFHVEAVKPTYRLALLTALSFLLVAPLPLQLHLGRPERSLEMYLTPHTSSAMAMFGFVYLWYLMAVILLEVWLEYRKEIVLLSQSTTGVKRLMYRVLTLGSSNLSEGALKVDDKVGWVITLIGIPSAFLLHGYVGFIFGSIKANPWWNTPLMPVVFLFSAMVSGIAIVLLIYMASAHLRHKVIDMRCVDTIAQYLLYTFIIDFGLEMLDLIHRIYEADESFHSLNFMMHTKLFFSQVVLQICPGDAGAHSHPGLHPDLPCAGTGAEVLLRRLWHADHHRHLRHALERGHRRPVVQQELSWLHHIQSGLDQPRGGTDCRRPAVASLLHSGGDGEDLAALAARRGECRGLTSRSRINRRGNAGDSGQRKSVVRAACVGGVSKGGDRLGATGMS